METRSSHNGSSWLNDRRCVIITFRDWLEENLEREQICELARYGSESKWPGLTDSSHLVGLYERFEGEIWEALAEDADDTGYSSVPEFLSTFRRADCASTAEGFKLLLVWFMVERTAETLARQWASAPAGD